MFGSKYAKELRTMIAEYKAKYGTPNFYPDFQFDPDASDIPLTGDPELDELIGLGKLDEDAVRAYTAIGQKAISAMGFVEDLQVAKLIWNEERRFFESAQDYTLLSVALLLWCRKKGAKEEAVHRRQIEQWNEAFAKGDCRITLFPYWIACGMNAERLQDEWANLFEKETRWYNTH